MVILFAVICPVDDGMNNMYCGKRGEKVGKRSESERSALHRVAMKNEGQLRREKKGVRK